MSMLLEKRDHSAISSSHSISGFRLSGVDAGEAATFIHFMSTKIYERIFQSALDSLSMTKQQSREIKLSAADSYSPKTKGFIKFLAKAASRRSDLKLYGVRLSTGEWLFNDQKPADGTDTKEFVLDFSSFDEAGLVAAACGMMYQVMNAAAKGIKSSETILVKLEDLAKQVSDKATKKALREQLKEFESAWREGRLVYTSSGSDASFISFDTTPSSTALDFCYSIITMVTGYPLEFLNGVGGSSLSDTGASTEKSIARADEHYANSVINPFLNLVFGYTLEPKPSFGDLSGIIPVITFVETSALLTDDDKRKILMSVGISGEGVTNDFGRGKNSKADADKVRDTME